MITFNWGTIVIIITYQIETLARNLVICENLVSCKIVRGLSSK
jgi:hypothetical protein